MHITKRNHAIIDCILSGYSLTETAVELKLTRRSVINRLREIRRLLHIQHYIKLTPDLLMRALLSEFICGGFNRDLLSAVLTPSPLARLRLLWPRDFVPKK
jgi:hypothetical protein